MTTTPSFDLYSLGPGRLVPGAPLVVYIEGDGYAWISRNRISDDPTPRRLLVLELALADPRPNVVYLARPCQYVRGSQFRNCQPAYWDTAGYAPEVIEAFNVAIDRFARKVGASQVFYVGYSGGGAVATLVAARRSDTAGLITVAGVLDHETWTKLDGLGPLRYSLNPADETARVVNVPQLHFSGGRDRVVPSAVARAYAARYPRGRRPAIEVLDSYDHECCWAEGWRDLISRPLPRPGEP
ncbi:alpha/beta hydrolase family protein [Paramagnetospirillum magneticum]|uniref:alpha/beta hydrolase family protein n=1 Tax=Paramagnetospirillum magneticum TaxID=84159 RepID=UPI0011D12B73|nr:alpha/beta hydrolase [Paramagnetospirillum magneticum]